MLINFIFSGNCCCARSRVIMEYSSQTSNSRRELTEEDVSSRREQPDVGIYKLNSKMDYPCIN
jgi:hypothetical protein